jgi:hypothetical protein
VKHTIVKLLLHRNGVIRVAGGAVLLSGLIFGAGYLAGMRHGTPTLSSLPSFPAVPTPLVPKAQPVIIDRPKVGTPPPPVEPAQFAVRAGLFPSNEEATAFAQQLTARKLDATVAAMPTSSGAMLYTVRFGQYANRNDAAAAMFKFRHDYGIDGAIVTIQPEPLQH